MSYLECNRNLLREGGRLHGEDEQDGKGGVYLKKVAEAYLKADKKTKGMLLDECMRNTSMNRKT